MNASESIARGCSIAGANRLGMLKANACNFVRFLRFPIYILIHDLSKENQLYGRKM
jgi:hypothetical protein